MNGFGFANSPGLTGGEPTDAELTDGVLGRRLVAWLIDSVILTVILAVLGILLFIFGVVTLGLAMPLLGGLWVVPTVYTFLFVASGNQATPGQALTGLRVVRNEDFGKPTPAQAVVFAVGFWLTMAAGVVWLLVALVTWRGRCLHDIVSGLLVVPQAAIEDAPPPWPAAYGGFKRPPGSTFARSANPAGPGGTPPG